MTQTTGTFWLIERTGEDRQAFGPYPSLVKAKAEAGKLYAVVTCTPGRLRSAQTLSRGEVRNALQAGSIRTADGTHWDSL